VKKAPLVWSLTMICPPRTAVFLDRDGVVNRCYLREGTTRPPQTLEQLEILPGVESAVADLAAAGFLLIVVTNQPDVARGDQSHATVNQIHEALYQRLAFDDIFACFHDEHHQCACRKPKPGMMHAARDRWNVDLSRSFLVGDRWSDVVAGQAAGCHSILVDTPFSKAEKCRPDYTARDLRGAADWILQTRGDKR
jgi:D-glycero-D-manno-heptose 1,7-bisphosphate phosphatase